MGYLMTLNLHPGSWAGSMYRLAYKGWSSSGQQRKLQLHLSLNRSAASHPWLRKTQASNKPRSPTPNQDLSGFWVTRSEVDPGSLQHNVGFRNSQSEVPDPKKVAVKFCLSTHTDDFIGILCSLEPVRTRTFSPQGTEVSGSASIMIFMGFLSFLDKV